MKIVIVDDDCLVTGALKTILEALESMERMRADCTDSIARMYC